MSEVLVGAEQSGPAGLSQMERVVDTFIAPSKTFEDIRRSSSWWMPWLLSSILALLFAYVVLNKIGLPTLVDGAIHQSASAEERIANATPEQAAAMRRSFEYGFKILYFSPVLGLIFSAIFAGIFLATANFVFGGRAKFKQMFAVVIYGFLPNALLYVLAIISIYAGLSGDSFSAQNPVGTNVGYYLMGGEAPHWLVTLLSSADVVGIWSAILLTIGVSKVAGIKRVPAAVVVFGWWGVSILLRVAGAAFGG